MDMHRTSIGWKVGGAADFLIELLAGKELPSVEVYQLASEAGIVNTTLSRAKRIVGAKSRRSSSKWLLSVPEEIKGRVFSVPKPLPKEHVLKPAASWGISSDWVSAVAVDDGGNGHKTDILVRASPGGLRVKVGMYEFEADEGFPADKLADLLRSLAVKDE